MSCGLRQQLRAFGVSDPDPLTLLRLVAAEAADLLLRHADTVPCLHTPPSRSAPSCWTTPQPL